MSVQSIHAALNVAISTALAMYRHGKNFSRKSALTAETVIRLFISAEGGSLDKIIHTAGLNVTASAVSQRRAHIQPEVFRNVFDHFNAGCVDNDL